MLDPLNESELCDLILESLFQHDEEQEEEGEGRGIDGDTFEANGVLTTDKGLVITAGGKTFQVTVKEV